MQCLFRLLITCLFFHTFLQAQTIEEDSLKQVFTNESIKGSDRFEAGTDLVLFQFRTNIDSARVTATALLQMAERLKNPEYRATALRLIGNTYAVQSKFEQALEHFLRSHEILLEMDDIDGLTTTFNNIGTVYYELGNYTQAQEYLLQSLKLAEETNNELTASRALNNLGNVQYDQSNNEQALEYYSRSLALKEKLGQRFSLPLTYNNIGLIYTNLEDHEKAVENLTQSATIAEEVDDMYSMTRAYSNLGIEYSRIGEYETALHILNESIKMKLEINDLDGLASSYLYRGDVYLKTNRFKLAQADCSQSFEMARTSGAQNLQKEALGCLSSVSEALGDYKSSLAFQKEYISLKDSLFNKEKTQELTRAAMNYEFEKQQLASTIAFEQDLNEEHQKFFITLITSLVVIAGMLFLYWKYNQNLKYKKLENVMLNSELEHQQNDLTNFAVNISNNQAWAESLAEKLEVIKTSTGRKRGAEMDELEAAIKNKVWVNKESEEFYKKIDAFSSAFYNKLTTQFEGLTKTEIRLCSLIKLNLDTKQIAVLQNINPSSVKMSRNRLRKKLNLGPEDDLHAFLQTL